MPSLNIAPTTLAPFVANRSFLAGNYFQFPIQVCISPVMV